jgi:hypothetical protein
VRFLVQSRSIPDVDRAGLVNDEYRLVDELHESGFLKQIYVRKDLGGAISIVEADSEEVVRQRLAELPFSIHGCVKIEQVLAVSERW